MDEYDNLFILLSIIKLSSNKYETHRQFYNSQYWSRFATSLIPDQLKQNRAFWQLTNLVSSDHLKN